MIKLLSLNYSTILLYLIVQDVYFDDESAEVVISSLELGDDHGRYFYYFLIHSYCTPKSEGFRLKAFSF